MRIVSNGAAGDPQTVFYHRCTIDLARRAIDIGDVRCRNLEEVLGGFGRSFQYLAARDVADAFATENPMVVNTGLLTGSNVMTGLRTYFSAYSPLKVSNKGLPAAMWSAGSGKFGSKLKWTGLDELILENKADRPVIIVIRESDSGPRVELRPADHLLGKYCHEKILTLYAEFPNAHFAAIGPAGEHYEACYYAAIALSTENLLRTGDDKCRWAGRGGMGAVLGSKNVIGIVAEATDRRAKLTTETRALNKEIATGPGSRKFREKTRGGLGGTWANYEPLEQFHMVPQNNFRPTGDGTPELMFRDALEDDFVIKAESCYRCGINCHKNIYERKADGSKGVFRAKFDYEPLNLLSTNAGVHDPHEVWPLVALIDHLGMDSISCGTTITYVLDYNARHPDAPVFNGATFGDADKIRELIEQVGTGQLPDLGQGSKRLSEQLGETDYAMHCKGLELPAYVPDTNPGYPWAVAGGHMSMATYMLVAMEGDTSLDYWVKAITERGLLMVRDDLLGVCKFAGLNAKVAARCLGDEIGLQVTREALLAAVRRAFIRALWLERKQGYERDDYTMPAQVFDRPNPAIKAEPFVTREFFAALSDRVWEVFDREIASLTPVADEPTG